MADQPTEGRDIGHLVPLNYVSKNRDINVRTE
jgi:hypothetical protein